MDARLAQITSLQQKDRGTAFLALTSEILSKPDQNSTCAEVHTLVEAVVAQDNVVIGRQVLSEISSALSQGAIKEAGLKKQIVLDTLETVQPRLVSYEEQVSYSTYIISQNILRLSRSIHCGLFSRTFMKLKKSGKKQRAC